MNIIYICMHTCTDTCAYTHIIYTYIVYPYIRTEEEGWPPSGANEDTLFIAWDFSKLMLRVSRFKRFRWISLRNHKGPSTQ